MAAHQSHAMSDINSIGTYDSLFDDDVGTLGGICLDLDVQQVVPSNNEHHGCHNGASSGAWCKSSSSSNSSCCSLCRLPAVSEAEDDESNMYVLANNDASFHQSSRPRVLGGTTSSQERRNEFVFQPSSSRGQFKHTAQTISCCASCNGINVPFEFGNCGQCQNGNLCQVPIKSISIPRSCIEVDPFAEEVTPTKASYNGCDYLSSFPDDALCHIIKFLDVTSLIQLRQCNQKLWDAASNDTAGWPTHCTRLWSTKANVCSAAKDMLAETSKISNIRHDKEAPKFAAMDAYKLSVIDAARRKEISFEEICFDSSPSSEKKDEGIAWSFRFKESAGRDWTSWDPWWNHQKARKLVFLTDGAIMQAYPQGLENSTAKTVNGTRLYDVFSERTVQRDGVQVPAPRIEMKWRFVSRPLDLPVRPNGAYVRITVGGRDVPTYLVRRSPNGNWGFILESCWGIYASYELAPQVPPTSHVLGRRNRSRRRLRRTRNGSRWVNVEDSDSDGSGADGDDSEHERERMRNVRRRIDLFVEESSMTQDGHSQWREALLYNIGSVTLPEGNGNSTEEFDNAWQNAMMR